MPATSPAKDRIDPALRRLVWILVLGALAPALDSTIVNVALATLGRTFHTSVATTQWTLTGYLLAMGMAMPATGWATQRLGAKRLWLLSLAAFVAGSALSGAAWSMTSLIVFRVLQGAAAGLMLPLAMTLMLQASGPQRLGRVMAMATLPVVVVPVLGPVVGGLILSNLSWRWIFYVNVPVCLAAIGLAWRGVAASPPTQTREPLDLVGVISLSPSLALIVYGLAQAAGPGGFTSPSVIVPLAVGLVLLAAFTLHALGRRARALVNLRVFRFRSFAAGASVFLLAGLCLYGPLLLLALYYQEVRGDSALITGLLLAPQGIGSLLPRTVAGKLTDRLGARPVVVVGLLLTAAGTVAFALVGAQPQDWLLILSLAVRGAGLAAATIAVMAGAFQQVPRIEVPDGSTTMRIIQQVGGSLGAAILTVILAAQLAGHTLVTVAAYLSAFHTAFWWAIGFSLLAILPALLLPARGHRARSTEPAQSASQRHLQSQSEPVPEASRQRAGSDGLAPQPWRSN